ncbi:mammalian cell entry protein [Mycobacterium paraense]|uniref:Mammalian cell entry protein n=1 Tax=Mycobacterium paraense TaxID=767916 RepID=A0ABX3VR48_9MYCO|nr:MCE family protein [Mycobacterium paraense]ORW32752.1 mammalian cell entry protein [Mycobacterium paraense]ORW44978.1 mammalian cell entry protein [Mycobacterium paraense]
MGNGVRSALWRLGVFVGACSLALFALLVVFAQLRFQKDVIYRAEFTNVSGLANGNFVRIAGVEVGKVKKISIKPDATVVVEFSTDDSVMLTHGTAAAIRYENLVGGRYLALREGPGSSARLKPGETIPLSQSEPALDLDALVGGFRPLFRALNPDQVNALSGQLISMFQGEGGSIADVLNQVSTLTGALADRDNLIEQLITNLNAVVASVGDQAKQLDKALDSVSQLVGALAERKVDVTNSLAYGNAAAATIADLLEHGRPAIQNTLHQTDRTAGLILADRDYLDDLLASLPDTYRLIGRQGIYGDYYAFYSCEILLKVNGKGGQPVYIQLSKQTSGRCAPK